MGIRSQWSKLSQIAETPIVGEILSRVLQGKTKIIDPALSQSRDDFVEGMNQYIFSVEHGVESQVVQKLKEINSTAFFGFKFIRKLGQSTNEECGSGGWYTQVLAAAVSSGVLERLQAGDCPDLLVKGLQEGTELALQKLRHQSRRVMAKEDISWVTTSYTKHNPELGVSLAEPLKRIGRNGIINIHIKPGPDMYRINKGIRLHTGYLDERFINNKINNSVEFTRGSILICEKPIHDFRAVYKLRQFIKSIPNALLIIGDINKEIIPQMLEIRQQLKKPLAVVCLSNMSSFADILREDVAALTGASVIKHERDFSTLNEYCVGMAQNIIVTKDYTDFEGDPAYQKIRTIRLGETLDQLELATDIKEKEFLRYRAACYGGGFADLYVGGSDEEEAGARGQEASKVVKMVLSTLEDGYLPGSGLPLVHAADYLNHHLDINPQLSTNSGVKILSEALSEPFIRDVEHKGLNPSDVVNLTLSCPNDVSIFDVNNQEYKNLILQGNIVPAKGVMSSVEKATQVGCLIATATSHHELLDLL